MKALFFFFQGQMRRRAFFAQPLLFQRLGNGRRQAGQAIFEQIIRGALLDAFRCDLFAHRSGNHDERRGGTLLPQYR